MSKFFRKYEDSPLFTLVFVSVGILIFGGVMGIFFYLDKAEEARVEAMNAEELLIYNLNETKYQSSQMDYVNEYIEENNIKDIAELEKRFSNEDFSFIKDQYSKAVNYIYFNEESMYLGDIELAIEDSENGEDSYSSTAIENFLAIERDLLTPELEKKIFVAGTEMIQVREDAKTKAFLEGLKEENEEEKIYLAMKNAFNDITNFGENYVPEIHDDMVAQAASETFGISIAEANRIYIAGEMGEY